MARNAGVIRKKFLCLRKRKPSAARAPAAAEARCAAGPARERRDSSATEGQHP